MNFNIRKMLETDRIEVLSMMNDFYNSPAVSTNGSLSIFNTDIDCSVGDSPFLEGYIFETNSMVLGYSMIAKSFSTEFGKSCIWLEDLYLKPEYRGHGIIPKFFCYIEALYPNAILKLEVEKENKHAVHVYTKHGFKTLEYYEMKKDI